MRNAYLSLDGMGIIIMLILLYANIFEAKLSTNKVKLFTQLLFTNLVVVVADFITWIDVGWSKMPLLFSIIISITYVVPFVIQPVFARYIYEHLSEKCQTSRKPFDVVIYYSILFGVVSAILCILGKMFVVKDGMFYEGSYDAFYYLSYLLSMLYIIVVIIINKKSLGLHDTIVSISYCLFPLLSFVVVLAFPSTNLVVPFMSVNMLIVYIFLQIDWEKQLLYQSHSDELTRLHNRRAYENDMMTYPDVPPEQDFVYASIDINGLKYVNDTYGHAAGDELISAAAHHLRHTFGNYGRVYRTGGDEFVSMFFADEKHLNRILEDLKDRQNKWKGKHGNSLALAVGFATKREFATQNVAEMAAIADQRMYEDKEQYYLSNGIDRREK